MTDAHQITLRSVLHDVAKERSYVDYELEVTPIFTGGANYSSKLYGGKIIAPDRPDLKFFAKVAAVGDDFREQAPTDLFYTEQFAYKTLSGIFDKIQDDNNVASNDRLRMPKLYGWSSVPPHEVVVMEDLSTQGFATHDRHKAFQWPYAAAAVRQLAIFHALSTAMEHNYNAEYEELKNNVSLKKFNGDESIMSSVEQTVDRSVNIVDEENRERLRTYLAKNMPAMMSAFYELQERPVLVHGDFRMSNTMHKVHEDGKCEVIVLDYQTLHIGYVAKDLLYFIFTGSDSEFRKDHYQQLLDHYYVEYSMALMRLRLDPEKILPKKEFDNEIQKNLSLGIIFALFSLPVVTVEEQNAPALDQELKVESILRVEASQVCKERLNGIIRDYVQWGIL